MSGAAEEWLTDERLAELLKEAKEKGDEFDPLLRAALLEIRQRRSWISTPAPPPRQARFSEDTFGWARSCFEHDVQNLCDDPYGVAGPDDDRGREVAVLEEWELLEAVAAELQVDLEEVFRRVALPYEQHRMEKILASARLARGPAAAEAASSEDVEAL